MTIFYFLLLWSALYYFVPFIIMFLSILILNPRRKERILLIKIILGIITVTIAMIAYFMFSSTFEGVRFAPFSFVYLGTLLIAIWTYPLHVAARK